MPTIAPVGSPLVWIAKGPDALLLPPPPPPVPVPLTQTALSVTMPPRVLVASEVADGHGVAGGTVTVEVAVGAGLDVEAAVGQAHGSTSHLVSHWSNISMFCWAARR